MITSGIRSDASSRFPFTIFKYWENVIRISGTSTFVRRMILKIWRKFVTAQKAFADSPNRIFRPRLRMKKMRNNLLVEFPEADEIYRSTFDKLDCGLRFADF